MSEHTSRQGFLGPESDDLLRSLTVGIIGLGGGGSHVTQQLAHVGIGNFVLVDPDRIEVSNLNRLIGGTLADVLAKELKTVIASRVVHGVNPDAVVIEARCDWRHEAEQLRSCDVLVGCVDSYRARSELEVHARRYLIPYIDLGMDVHQQGDGSNLISGQVILSLPGRPCMRCMGFLRDALLEEEARRYGDAGPRPQVVWPNGLLASAAVGTLMHLFLPWGKRLHPSSYLEYDGNRQTLKSSHRLEHVGSRCSHFAQADLGDPWFSMGKMCPTEPSSSSIRT